MSEGAGYSGTPLPRKLGIKPGHVVLLDRLPPELSLDLPEAHVVRRLRAGLDVTLTFSTSLSELTARLPAVFSRTVTDGMVWVAWPKKSAVRAFGISTDLDASAVRSLGLELGWVDVKIAAISEVWSGLKFVRRLVDR